MEVFTIKHYFKVFIKRIEQLSDSIADISANPIFLLSHIVWWGSWIGFQVEPFPYGLLTLIVSLEAIMLSSLILSSGNREGEAEKKIARKGLRLSNETNIIVEEILGVVKDLQDDLRILQNEED